MTDEYEEVRIKQTRGPVLAFSGKLLASDERETRGHKALSVRLEIWETKGGALVPATYAKPLDGGFEDVRAAVVEPQPDPQAMHLAVMDFFSYDNHARGMVRKQLGWELVKHVD